MSRYAKNTKVPVAQSVAEIQKTVEKYGSTGFQYAVDEGKAGVAFKIPVGENQFLIRFTLPLPDDPQEVRQRWRAMLLTVKSKLESVESEIETFEEAFMAHLVLPDGRTVAERLLPDVQKAISQGGAIPQLLIGGAG